MPRTARSFAALRMTRRTPLLHFLLIGALLFTLQQWLPSPSPAREPLRLTAAELQELRAQWPGENEFQAALQRHIGQEVLLREALRLGLDRSDPVVRERTLSNMHFAFPGRSQTEGATLREARLLGMPQRDVVVRRRLIQRMEQRLARSAAPTEAALAQYAALHEQRYGSHERLTFRQVFFSSDRPKADIESAARQALAQLRAGQAAPSADPFLLGSEFASITLEQIGRSFGAEFATTLSAAPLERWAGPYPSAYGLHLVRIEARAPAESVDWATLRPQLAYAVQHEQEQQGVREATAALRAEYRVELP